MTKRLQIFVHRWYDGIKLSMIAIILVLAAFGILNAINLNAEESEERGKAVLKISAQISRENEEQTRKINRQFQALCFIIVQTAGEDALKKLDPPLEEQCRNLTAEIKRDEARVLDDEPDVQPPVAPAPQRQERRETQADAEGPQPSAPEQPSPRPAERQPNVIESLVQGINDLLRQLVRPQR